MEYQLSKRLSFIASFVTSDMRIGDIGSDHGYLPYYLLSHDKETSLIQNNQQKVYNPADKL